MKFNAIKVVMVIAAALLLLAGCGGGGSISIPGATGDSITSVGWLYEDDAPDYTSGPGCRLVLRVYYDESIPAADIDSVLVTSPNGVRWMITSSNGQLGTSGSGKPYLGANIYYGDSSSYIMPLAGNWQFELRLKNGQISLMQKTLHEPGSSAGATHPFVYSKEDWSPSIDASQYAAALGRFPAQGYTVQYSAVNGGMITSRALSAVRTSFRLAEPHAYNMFCWLFDANKNYLGYTISEFSPQDHSRTNLIDANGELSIVPASTVSSTGQVDLSAVKYVRFVCTDGAQYEPSSYSNADYRSISSLVRCQPGTILLGGALQGLPLSLGNNVTTFAGLAPAPGAPNYGFADGTGANARFNAPAGITTDGTNLYVADNINHTIRKIVISTGAVTTIAGGAGIFGSADGSGTAARFHDPFGITTDGSSLFIADYNNNSVRKMDLASGMVTTLAGNAGTMGSSDGMGAGASFAGLSDITNVGGCLYVADTFNNTIRKIDKSTGAVTTVAGAAGIQGSADGAGAAAHFYWPSGITTDGANLYVTDSGNGTIRKIVIATGVVTTFAGTAGARVSTDGIGPAALFRNPTGITSDGACLYVTDVVDNIIRKITIGTGAVTTIAGTAGVQGAADGYGPAATFYWPAGITTDGRNLFVVDSQNNTIRKIY